MLVSKEIIVSYQQQATIVHPQEEANNRTTANDTLGRQACCRDANGA